MQHPAIGHDDAKSAVTFREIRSKGLQRMVVPFGPCGQALGTSARTECVCQLGHCEDAFASVPCPFLPSQIGEEAEIVFADCVLSASVMEPALRTMPVENRIIAGSEIGGLGWRSATGHQETVKSLLHCGHWTSAISRKRPLNRGHRFIILELRQCKSYRWPKLSLNNHSRPARRNHQHSVLFAQHLSLIHI